MKYLTQHWVLHLQFSTKNNISAHLLHHDYFQLLGQSIFDIVIYYILLVLFLTVVFLSIHIFYFHWFYFPQIFIPFTKFLSARGISKTFPVCKFDFVKGSSATTHCVKSVRIRSYSGPHFPAFGLNTQRYGVSLCVQTESGKMRTRITPNTGTFHAVTICSFNISSMIK